MMKKGKLIVIIVAVLCLLAALLIGGIMLFGGNPGVPAEAANGSTDWYDENGKEFVITTVEELYGMAELSKTHDFKGQTIKLGADIVINEGNASQWADKAPEYLWNPIVGFAGTFDGQGRTISGVYGNSIVTSLGLFTDTQKTSEIKNLNLVNSFFKNNNDMGTGSIIGIGGGKLENVFSDAVLAGSGDYVGGLIGCVKTKGENQITNCWFDGSITVDGYDCSGVGGLVGAYTVEDAINAIEHSLSTADITCMGENVGGICGYVGNGAFLNLTDSMFTGTLVYDTNKYAVVGSVVGQSMGSASIIVNDTYTVDDIANRTIGTSAGYQKGNAIAVGKDYLVGVGGYQWTTLDFENYWVAQKDGMPRLRYFTQETVSIDGVEKMVDISWYDQAGASFEITTVQQFYGFAYLSRSYDFRGQTIKLGADITVNEGNASTWGEKAPAYNWTPIAWYGSSLSQRFKGTFDGQGHTISGIYAKGTENITSLGLFGEVYHGAVVKNFKLVNSYFEGVQSADIRGPVGSVAGRLRGTIEDVYSDAIVVNSSKNTGGIVGMITGTGQNLISGCWFDGTLTGITRSGGILGGVYGNKGNIEATIEHCLNTGDIRVAIGQAGVGGICGTAETWSILYVDDCLNAGTFGTFGTGKAASKHVGTLVGTVTQTDSVGSKAVITHSYGVKEFFSRLVGWKFGDEGLSQASAMFTTEAELIGYGGYRWTTLDFNNHWAVRLKDVPVPVAFADTKPSVAGQVRMVDYSWYSPDKNVYTIRTFQQLYGMARLWDSTNLFKGKTIRLGADITINKGNAADWAEKAPAFVWEPMKFSGTFDGQGHTISGIYVKGGAQDNYVGFFHRIYKGGTVKNLKITNSYIEGTMDAGMRGAVGSLAGRSNGIIDTVYSDAIVVNSARMTGGLVGMITAEGENQIRNSWFDGKITGINRTGGILGGIYGNKSNIKVQISTCVNTGDIAVKIGSGDVGGICGIAETGGTLCLTDCVNAGTFSTVGDDKEANTHIGSVFGSVTQKDGIGSRVELNNVYGVEEFYSKLVGWKYGDEGLSRKAAVMLGMDTLTAEGGYRYTDLDYKNAWGLNKENVPVPMAFASTKVEASGLENQMDYSWFDAQSETYTITTREQLEAFAVLCGAENDYFKGKTVKLGADITMNEGEAAKWAEAAPANVWTPVNFNGTFDGQGHTISGLYVNSTKQYSGFFSTVNSGAVVKNLKLVNSYIEGNGSEDRSGVGSIAGRSHGTIDTVYSNAILKNNKQMTGGIVGMVTGEGENKISNCWFDGQIEAINGTGGILGSSYGQTAAVEHCLNTGALNIASGSQIGGLVGYVQGAANVTVSDSLNAGKLTAAAGVKQMGTVVGSLHDKGTLTLAGAYGVKEFNANAVGYRNKGTLNGGSCAVQGMENLKGYGAYQRTVLDFEGGSWVLKKDAIPALGVFDTTDLSLEEAKTLPDYRWYDENADTYVLTTVQQLRGFNDLCNADTDYFAGKTIKLGADITLNEDSAADWASKAPAVVWKNEEFKGTFDGQNHTVSGVYVMAGTHAGFFKMVHNGAAVKNLKLVNSYIENTKTSGRSGTGSIAGRSYGVIENVYSTAIVKSTKGAAMTGGIVGMIDKAGQNKITNCWFAGTIYGGRATGGILGGVYAAEANVEHCLNTGTMHITENSEYVGGLIGELQNVCTAQIKDSLNAGALDGTVTSSGTILGRLDKADSKLTLENTYGTSEFLANAVGSAAGTVTGSNYKAIKTDNLKGYSAYQYTKLDFDGGIWVLKKDAIPALGLFDTSDLSLDEAKKLPDYSWYDENSNVYVIATAGQLCGFNDLCNADTDYFAGKTIKLGADITLNEGNAADWASKAPAVVWKHEEFKGTFDGQNHTVSGVYVMAGTHAGFFKMVHNGAAVKNLKLVNSYIENTKTSGRSGTGSIAGRSYGVIENVYSTAIVRSTKGAAMTGGIVGMIDKAGQNKISNCWFAGTIYGGRATGGILGGAYAAEANVEHCLNTGTMHITENSEFVGGLVGELQKACNAAIKDSLNAGTLVGTVTNSGTVLGRVDADAAVNVEKAYGTQEFLNMVIGKISGTVTGSEYAVRKLEDIKGYGAYQYTKLDFESGTWVLMNDTPRLGAFSNAELSLEDAKTLPDYSWYDENAETHVLDSMNEIFGYVELREKEGFVKKPITLNVNELTLSSEKQLRAFAVLCADGVDFAGKTVKLDGDIALNGAWTPVNFGGTFDGQCHTISGLTASLFAKLDGAVVKNLKLTNSVAAEAAGSTISHCVLTNAEASILGIAKDGTTLEHCYSDGGLIAEVQGTTVVNDSLAAGAAVTSAAEGKLTMTNVYGIGESNGTVTIGGAAYTVRKLADLQGYGAYQWTTLDFDGGTWVLKKDAVPALGAFDATDLSLDEAKKLPDYNWYGKDGDAYVLTTARQMVGYVELSEQDGFVDKTVTLGSSTYTLTTAEELLAFNTLSAKTDYFAGKTVKLGADITLNEGNMDSWVNNPAIKWTPASIKGTFDGQGHTVSGAYVSSGSTYVGFFHSIYTGGTVKNLKLVNSYIRNTKTSGNCGTGSIAGRCLGTVDSVYSNATVTNGAAMTGGIVGMVVAVDGVKDGNKTISNCWFDGVINGNAASGGILGGSYGMQATIEHCLNTGTLRISAGKKQLGGLVGYVQGAADVKIRDSVNAGELDTTSTSQIGTIVGAAAKNALTVGNVYGITEFTNKLYGWTGSAPTVETDSVCEMAAKADYYGSGAANLSFGVSWVAREGKIPMLKVFEAWANGLGK